MSETNPTHKTEYHEQGDVRPERALSPLTRRGCTTEDCQGPQVLMEIADPLVDPLPDEPEHVRLHFARRWKCFHCLKIERADTRSVYQSVAWRFVEALPEGAE